MPKKKNARHKNNNVIMPTASNATLDDTLENFSTVSLCGDDSDLNSNHTDANSLEVFEIISASFV